MPTKPIDVMAFVADIERGITRLVSAERGS